MVRRKGKLMTTRMYRQGDVLFTAIPELPEGLTPRKSQVIVEGEATGHAHRLLEGSVLADAQGALFLEVLAATQVIHQEHHPIDLEPGYYQVTRQREYTPEAIRAVAD
jgi:hypothetical protein